VGEAQTQTAVGDLMGVRGGFCAVFRNSLTKKLNRRPHHCTAIQ